MDCYENAAATINLKEQRRRRNSIKRIACRPLCYKKDAFEALAKFIPQDAFVVAGDSPTVRQVLSAYR